MSQAKILYRFQKLDLELDARRYRVSQITATLEQDSTIRQAQAEVDALQEALRHRETHAADLNLELQSVASQVTELGNHLYGGHVNNPKELGDIENKIAERKRHHASLENDLLETMIAVEELQASLSEAARLLNEVKASRATEHQALIDEMQRLKGEIKTLKTNRKALETQITPDNLELYQTLRAKKQGHAVAFLDGEACSRCKVDQTTLLVQQVRQDHEIIMCDNCGRILVAL